jgi:hypothetical protein
MNNVQYPEGNRELRIESLLLVNDHEFPAHCGT